MRQTCCTTRLQLIVIALELLTQHTIKSNLSAFKFRGDNERDERNYGHGAVHDAPNEGSIYVHAIAAHAQLHRQRKKN